METILDLKGLLRASYSPMEFRGSILQTVESVSASIGKWWKYHIGLDKNMEILESNLKELNSLKEDIESRLSADLGSGMKLPKEEVQNWLANVQKINIEVQDIGKKVGEKRCRSRASLRKLVDEKIQGVKELHKKCGFPDGLVVDAPLTIEEVTFPTTLVGETTTKKYMNEIWAYLLGDEIWKIGVYGLGGAGKTTIMMHIKNQLREKAKKFDYVIWVTASRKLNVIKLQEDIARGLHEYLGQDEDKTRRAGKLLEMLERKKYVLILDDIWDVFSLEEVGIPEPTAINGCKLVLITRSRDVCRCMNCKVVRVGRLSKEEAWNLFSDKVGHDVLNIPTLVPIVKFVSIECVGLPLAIIIIATCMKGVYDRSEWRNALKELRRLPKGVESLESRLIERLKFSYDRLKDLKVQHYFLQCALWREGCEIKKRMLIEYWIAERLEDEMPSRRAEFDKGYDILRTLENSYLLERSSTSDGLVKMHNLVMDMVLNITSRSPRFMAKAGMQLNELPNEQEWMEDLEKVSLMENSISEIPFDTSPKCQRLETLLLQDNPLKSISNSFFGHMLGLKVLDLSHTNIEILPDSISNLEHLTALLLRECYNLNYVPSLAALKALRKLDLMHIRMEEVPQGMEMLVNLRCLYLGGHYLKTLPTEILPKLSRLQCLIVGWGSSVKAEEVGSLRKLETFRGTFHDLQDFNVYARRILQGQGPNKYFLDVGSGGLGGSFDEEESHYNGRSKCVGLDNCNISRKREDPLVLPNDIDYLWIVECHDVSSLSHVSSLNTTDCLKECDIYKCDGIECVISYSSSDHTPFQSLEKLWLYRLQNLHVLIFRGEGASLAPPGTFSNLKTNLKTLDIDYCPKIKKLFTLELLPHFQNLESLYVNSCDQMEEIIAVKAQGEEEQHEEGKMCGSSNLYIVNHDDDGVFTITLPKLARLSLRFLPELKSIVCGRGVMICDSLQQIYLDGCPKLKRLPLFLPMLNGQPSPPPSLQRIQIDSVCWESLEWDHPTAKDVLQSFINYI